MKLAALHRKSSRQTRHADRPVDSAIARATRPVFRQKYVATAPTSGRMSEATSNGPDVPPRAWKTNPVAAIVMASALVLNTVLYSGYRRFTLTVHCVHAPATATRTAGRGPSSSSAIRSAAYDTDSVEPLASGIGRLIFQAEVRHAASSRKKNTPGSGNVRGNDATSAATPATTTKAT